MDIDKVVHYLMHLQSNLLLCLKEKYEKEIELRNQPSFVF